MLKLLQWELHELFYARIFLIDVVPTSHLIDDSDSTAQSLKRWIEIVRQFETDPTSPTIDSRPRIFFT